MDEAPPSFGTLLKSYREAARLTQEELADRAGLSVRGLRYLEQDVRRPYRDTVRRLDATLALPAHEGALFALAARAHTPPMRDESAAHSLPVLVGRTREVTRLTQHIRGEGRRLLLLAGEPGIGKSRLLDEAAQQGRRVGWRVLQGGCQRRGGHAPYAPLLEALQQYIARQAPTRQRADLQGCAWLVRLLPELVERPIEPLPAWMLPPDQERRLMMAAVERFLANVAGPAGTLLVLDDLQWVSPDALDLVVTLVRSPSDVPLRMVGAYRDTEAPPQGGLAVMLADLAQAGLAEHHTLAPLTLAEGAQILNDVLPIDTGRPDEATRRAQVVQRAGGVPFFVLSWAQALQSADDPQTGPSAVPWDLAHGIRQRLAALPESARAVLGLAAVVGRQIPHGLLVRVATHSEPEVLAALQAACRARLLQEDSEEQYQFVHDVIREVVEAEVGAAGRTILHRRVAEALEREHNPPVDQLAHHYGRSGNQEKAALYLEQAGDRARSQAAYEAAEGYYHEAAMRLVQRERSDEAAAVREKLGAVLHAAGRYDAAMEVVAQAAETYRRAGDLDGLARAMARLGQVHRSRSTPDEGIRLLQPMIEPLAARGPSASVAALFTVLARLMGDKGRFSEMLHMAERAENIARVVGDVPTLLDATLRQGRALYWLGRDNESLQVYTEASRRAEASSDLGSLSMALDGMTMIYVQRGEWTSHQEVTARILAIAEELGDPVTVRWLLLSRVFSVTFFNGDWAACHRLLDRATALSHRIGTGDAGDVDRLLLLMRGRLYLAEGAWEEGTRDVEESLALGKDGELGLLWEAQYLLAERDLLAGCPQAARARLAPFFVGPGLEAPDMTELMVPLAQAYLELDDVEHAAMLVTQAETRGRARNEWLFVVQALRVQAMVACRREQWAEAERALEEGVALARRMPFPHAEARLLQVYGAMHAQKGELASAQHRLEAALVIFRQLGARKDAERVEQAL